MIALLHRAFLKRGAYSSVYGTKKLADQNLPAQKMIFPYGGIGASS